MGTTSSLYVLAIPDGGVVRCVRARAARRTKRMHIRSRLLAQRGMHVQHMRVRKTVGWAALWGAQVQSDHAEGRSQHLQQQRPAEHMERAYRKEPDGRSVSHL